MSIEIHRQPSLEFTLPDGRTFVIPTPTRGKMNAVFALDPKAADEPEAPGDYTARIARQLAILSEGSGLPIEGLNPYEAFQILNALTVHHFGGSASAAVAVQRVFTERALAAVVASAEALSEP